MIGELVLYFTIGAVGVFAIAGISIGIFTIISEELDSRRK